MLDHEKIKKLNKNTWFFRFKKFDENKYLITNDVAKYSFLTKGEFWDYIEWKILSWDKYDELVAKGFIKTDAYKKEMAKKYVWKNSFLSYGPSLHIIVTTLRCDHKCQYCHAAVAPMTAKDMDMTVDTARKVVDTIFFTSNTEITIEFQWWESTINWDVVKFITEYAEEKAFALQKRLSFALVTNLTMMDDEKFDYILKHNINITTSLDWIEEIHNWNRVLNNWNSFEKVSYWIKKINKLYIEKNVLNERGNVKRIGALLTVTKDTLSKYKETIDTYIDLWLDWIFLRPLNPYGFAASDLKNIWYTTEEFIEFYKKSMDYIIELNKKGIIFRESLSSIYLVKMLTDFDPNFLDERSPCWACVWQVAYNYDWKIYSCDEWRMLARMWDDNFKMWEVKESWEETYKEMMESETTKVMVQASTLDWLPWYNDSVYKPYIWVCPIHSYKLTGNIISGYSKDTRKMLGYAVLDYLFEKIQDKETKSIFEKWIWLSDKKLSEC